MADIAAAHAGQEPPQLWTVAEVAEHMRVSTMTVYRLIKAGTLPAIRVGKNYRIRGGDLAAFLEAAATTQPGQLNGVSGQHEAKG
ncbi:DNA-binding protein [Egibacter rhizosphaerae]|uniref:DNA-binding protein n=1 Tax=Egibacter rhizosphaerae TaxID=1670831 RepID=A0A411YK13_9ACTN|nr:helix-turn-helix domain-containing protein [Egibacter rhizosphaerae]QBI21521.1 DNA-binding protein [Egibacter rhizosphaerae]